MQLSCLSVGLDNAAVYRAIIVLILIPLQSMERIFTSMVYLLFTSLSVCSLDLSYGTFFVFGIWQILSDKRILAVHGK